MLQITADNNDDIIVINSRCKRRERFVPNLQPEKLYQKPPGMSQRREVELFTKFRPLVPIEFRDIICPEPSKEVMEQVKADIAEKRATREAKKKEKTKPPTKIKKGRHETELDSEKDSRGEKALHACWDTTSR